MTAAVNVAMLAPTRLTVNVKTEQRSPTRIQKLALRKSINQNVTLHKVGPLWQSSQGRAML